MERHALHGFTLGSTTIKFDPPEEAEHIEFDGNHRFVDEESGEEVVVDYVEEPEFSEVEAPAAA